MGEYYEGMGCKCYARSPNECCCDGVDWTPKEVYELQQQVKTLKKKLKKAKEEKDHVYVAVYMNRAMKVFRSKKKCAKYCNAMTYRMEVLHIDTLINAYFH